MKNLYILQDIKQCQQLQWVHDSNSILIQPIICKLNFGDFNIQLPFSSLLESKVNNSVCLFGNYRSTTDPLGNMIEQKLGYMHVPYHKIVTTSPEMDCLNPSSHKLSLIKDLISISSTLKQIAYKGKELNYYDKNTQLEFYTINDNNYLFQKLSLYSVIPLQGVLINKRNCILFSSPSNNQLTPSKIRTLAPNSMKINLQV